METSNSKIQQINHLPRQSIFPANHEAKVKVQWIQNNKSVKSLKQEAETITRQEPQLRTTCAVVAPEEVATEELLDETQTGKEIPTDAVPFLDTFYTNAVECLIALYGSKYVEMQQRGTCDEYNIWTQISDEMNECYFAFDAEQVRHKFNQLRHQYFQVASADDIKACAHFNQLHEIYGNKRIEAIVRGEKECDTSSEQSEVYMDEALFQRAKLDLNSGLTMELNQSEAAVVEAEPESDPQIVFNVTSSQQHAEIIAHKEHEFIDMVEKELQTMGKGEYKSNFSISQHKDELVSKEAFIHQDKEQPQQLQQPPTATIHKFFLKREPQQQEIAAPILPRIKRFKIEVPTVTLFEHQTPKVVRLQANAAPTLPSLQQQQMHSLANQNQQPAFIESVQTTPASVSTNNSSAECSPISLSIYNAAQERRHCEKMELLRQSLVLQERAIEMQRQLMEQLINRL